MFSKCYALYGALSLLLRNTLTLPVQATLNFPRRPSPGLRAPPPPRCNGRVFRSQIWNQRPWKPPWSYLHSFWSIFRCTLSTHDALIVILCRPFSCYLSQHYAESSSRRQKFRYSGWNPSNLPGLIGLHWSYKRCYNTGRFVINIRRNSQTSNSYSLLSLAIG